MVRAGPGRWLRAGSSPLRSESRQSLQGEPRPGCVPAWQRDAVRGRGRAGLRSERVSAFPSERRTDRPDQRPSECCVYRHGSGRAAGCGRGVPLLRSESRQSLQGEPRPGCALVRPTSLTGRPPFRSVAPIRLRNARDSATLRTLSARPPGAFLLVSPRCVSREANP
jgi:hypothetical protein